MDKFDLKDYLKKTYNIPEEQDMTDWGLYFYEIEELLMAVHKYYIKEEKNVKAK